ncbi:MAG: Electron transport complex protein RnfG [Lentisphaerae bacterium ADurb.Bin242]|nr:MAG: Electron transport complex protein RnfG [Lentisphaerae bacterium ADurb.Bin242]
MNKNSTNMFYLGAFLCVVCAIAAGIMGYAAVMTRGPIEEAKTKKVSSGLRMVLPAFDNDPLKDMKTFQGHDKTPIQFYTARKDGKIVGFAATLYGTGGYAGRIDALVSFHPDGTIRSFLITGHTETPGLGTNVTDRVEEKTLAGLFREAPKKEGLPPNKILDQYAGHGANRKDSWGTTPWKIKKDGGQADFISGATITSRAVNEIAWKAASAFEEHKNELIGTEGKK